MPERHFRAASPLRTHFRNPLAADVAADPSNPKWVQLCATGKYVYRGQPIDIAPATFDEMVSNFRAHPAYDATARTFAGKPTAEVAPLVQAGKLGVIALNFDHPPQGAPRPGHGWFLDVERRGEQLWGLCFLDPEAHAGMLAAAWKWTSIEWADNAKNNAGETIGAYLSGVALTNDPFIQGMTPIQMGGAVAWFGPATDVLCELRCVLNLGETSDLGAVIGELAKLKTWALAEMAPPMGVDVAGLVARIRALLNLPTLCDAASIFQELDKLLSRLAAESPEEPMALPDSNTPQISQLARRLASRFKVVETDEPAIVLATEAHFQRGDEAMQHLTALQDALGAKDPKDLAGKIAALSEIASRSKENADALAALVPELEAAEAGEEAAEGEAVTADVAAVMQSKGMDPAAPENMGMSRALRLARIGGDPNFFRFSGLDAKGQPKKVPRAQLREKRATARAEFLREHGISLASGTPPAARPQQLVNYFAGPGAQHGPGVGQTALGAATGYMGFANGPAAPPPPPPAGAMTWETIAALPPVTNGDNPGARLVAHFARTELNGKIPDESTRTALWKRATAVVMALPPMPPAVHNYFSRAA